MKALGGERIHAVAVNFKELEFQRIRLEMIDHPDCPGMFIWYEPTEDGFKGVAINGPAEELEAAYQELLKGQAK